MEIANVAGREAELAGFIDRLVSDLEPLHLRYNESIWLASVTGESRPEFASDPDWVNRNTAPIPYFWLKKFAR